jgi:hypothetical protein
MLFVGVCEPRPEIVESQSTTPGRDWTVVPNPWRIDGDLSSSVNHWDHDTDCRCAVPTFELCRVIQLAVLYITARTRRSVYEPQSMKLVKAARVKLRRFHVERGTRSQDLCNQRHPKICAYCRACSGRISTFSCYSCPHAAHKHAFAFSNIPQPWSTKG